MAKCSCLVFKMLIYPLNDTSLGCISNIDLSKLALPLGILERFFISEALYWVQIRQFTELRVIDLLLLFLLFLKSLTVDRIKMVWALHKIIIFFSDGAYPGINGFISFVWLYLWLNNGNFVHNANLIIWFYEVTLDVKWRACKLALWLRQEGLAHAFLVSDRFDTNIL